MQLAKTKEVALISADVLTIVTEWQEFRAPDFDEIAVKLKYPAIFDGRNLYNPRVLAAHGIDIFLLEENHSDTEVTLHRSSLDTAIQFQEMIAIIIAKFELT